METKELLKKVRKIEIRTKRLTDDIFSGGYLSSFKGRGMAFSEVREYQFGDEIRTIDWNVTARFSKPYIKVFDEERELNVMIIADMSNSQNFGTNNQTKKDLLIEIAAILAFSASKNQDKIGLIIFTDKIEKFIPPQKGKSQILRIIRELLTFEPKSSHTDINMALTYFLNVIKQKSVAFIISDFLSDSFEKNLKIAGSKHDTIAVQLIDKIEENLPNLGMILAEDSETGETKFIDIKSKRVRAQYKKWWTERQSELEQVFKKSDVDTIKISTGESYINPLLQFFKRRSK